MHRVGSVLWAWPCSSSRASSSSCCTSSPKRGRVGRVGGLVAQGAQGGFALAQVSVAGPALSRARRLAGLGRLPQRYATRRTTAGLVLGAQGSDEHRQGRRAQVAQLLGGSGTGGFRGQGCHQGLHFGLVYRSGVRAGGIRRRGNADVVAPGSGRLGGGEARGSRRGAARPR